MSGRHPFAFGIACLVTLALFWVMQALVGVEGELSEGSASLRIDFVRLLKDRAPQTKQREPPKREKPEQPPPPPSISTSKSTLDPGAGIAAIAPQIDAEEALTGGIGMGAGADRDVVPLVRINPEYPVRALQRRIEGWVTLEFTITEVGSVEDVVVLASEPGTVFDRSAMQAVRKWKYNPKIEDGVAAARPGVRTTLEFTMED